MPYGIVFEFMDTGMGDGTLIQLPPWDSGGLCLFDFGERMSPFKIAARDATHFLVDRISVVSRNAGLTVPTLEMLFLSHPDGDHWNKVGWLINGATDIQANLWQTVGGWPQGTTLHINRLVFGGGWGEYTSRDQTISTLIANAVAAANGATQNLGNADHDAPANGVVTPRWTWRAGVQDEETKIYLLSSNTPTRNATATNPKSLVVMFEYGGHKVILTGDAESAVVEPAILNRYNANLAFLRSLVLKLGHHGSDGASSQAWLNAVRPEAVFASGDRFWGHPYCAPINRAILAGGIGTGPSRYFTCSAPNAGDYASTLSTSMVSTNIWYAVTNPAGQTLPAPDGTMVHGAYGLYTGVQWRLQLDPGSLPFMSHTDQWPRP